MNEEVTIQCDASQSGLEPIILQACEPVAFAPRALTQTKQQYAQIEKRVHGSSIRL